MEKTATLSASKAEAPVRIPIPEGKWLANNTHCEGELDIRASYELDIEQNSVTNIGITQNGEWSSEDIAPYEEAIEQALNNHANCLDWDSKDVTLARFQAPGNEYVIGFDRPVKPTAMIRIERNQSVIVLVPFNTEDVKQYTFIDSASIDTDSDDS
jgi:hypothetical protein